MKKTGLIGIWENKEESLWTKALVNEQVYDERIVETKDGVFREWNPYKSKIGAYLYGGATDIFVRQNQKILYLGIASGTTASHISDILGGGMIYGVDPAFRVMIKLLFLCEKRFNIAPILANGALPDEYEHLVPEVDLIIQDVAQRNQADIFIRNSKFLKKGGFGLIAVKARSIDVTKKPQVVFQEVRRQLEKHFTIVDFKTLEPFEKDHVMIVVKKK